MATWTSGSADHIKQHSGFGELVNRDTPLLRTFQAYGRVFDVTGKPSWPVYTTGVTAADITEGTDISTFYYQVDVEATQPLVAKQLSVRLGAVAEAIAEAGGTLPGARQNQIDMTIADSLKALESAFCASGQDIGLPSINDASGVYAGIDPASVTAWSSNELTAVNSSINGCVRSVLKEMSIDGANMNMLAIFAHPTARDKFQASAIASGSFVANSPPGGGATDPGWFPESFRYNGYPVVAVPSLPEGDIHILDMSDARLDMLQYPKVKDINGNSVDTKFAVTVMGCMRLQSRNKHGKVFNVDSASAY